MITNTIFDEFADQCESAKFFNCYLSTSKKRIEKRIGKPYSQKNNYNGDIQNTWYLKHSDGFIFMLYDYGEHRKFKKDEVIRWRIATINEEQSKLVQKELKELCL